LTLSGGLSTLTAGVCRPRCCNDQFELTNTRTTITRLADVYVAIRQLGYWTATRLWIC